MCVCVEHVRFRYTFTVFVVWTIGYQYVTVWHWPEPTLDGIQMDGQVRGGISEVLPLRSKKDSPVDLWFAKSRTPSNSMI